MTIPDDERMTAAELRTIREWLGLTGDALAEWLGVQPRALRRWEAGTYRIPDGVRLNVEELEAHTATQVDVAVGQLMDVPDPTVVVYHDDDAFWTAHPEAKPLTAQWHRRVVARAAQEVPGLGIDYQR
jgi:Domain of unknown function (DUF1870).